MIHKYLVGSSKMQKKCLFIVLAVLTGCVFSQSWVTERTGPASNDLGPLRDAIIRSEIIDIGQSPARFNGNRIAYAHPSCIDETRQGTIVIGFNGGDVEAEGNHAYTLRKPAGESWNDPIILEDGGQIDFGVIYQPRNIQNAPILAYYWLGGPPSNADGAIRYSTDDGATWSSRTLAPQSSYWSDNRGTMQCGMNHPLEWPDGTLWFASSDEGQGLYDCHAYITKVPPDNYANDGGSNWEVTDIQGNSTDGHTHGTWLILGKDAQGNPEEIIRMSRTNFCNTPTYRYSDNGGDSWGSWQTVSVNQNGSLGGISNLNCGISTVSLDWDNPDSPLNGLHVLAGSGHKRSALNVTISQDPLGGSWDAAIQLNVLERPFLDQSGQVPPIPSEVSDDHENADPTLFQARDGNIHLLFTGREGNLLKYYVIDPYVLFDLDATNAAKTPKGEIKFLRGNNSSIAVFDLSGKCLYRKDNISVRNFNLTSRIPGISTGMYYVSIRNNTGASVVKRLITE
ncbi:MAG: T9SS type A sorting domain-containing protein [Chitinivibrionales bacterium]|nr:T9SS type A sorting domain-containing protein [Chitinivibrionales bacterium]